MNFEIKLVFLISNMESPKTISNYLDNLNRETQIERIMISDKKQQTTKIIKRLKKMYPDAHCALNHNNAFELLVATILSAQCTDDRVNIVTATLFRKYRKPDDYFEVDLEELTEDIKSINFFNNKAKNIQAMARKIVDNFGGEVPQKMDELLTLNGVARKTANVVLGNAFGIASGVVVDTHVSRLSQRLGITEETTPEKIEKDLAVLVPKKDWVMFPHWMIFHGRQVCNARKPKCSECQLNDICPTLGV
ncbi:MAG TPA: endonuclease III [Pyrinomonadaceae bacterium]|nr:endonuclease III [Pyrinomonadaceae bacterium]